MENYINMYMRNNLNQKGAGKTENETETETVTGENMEINYPCGGFPPIYICSNQEKIREENKNREFTQPKKNTVSIKEIMQKRRDPTPFVSI